MYASYFYFEDFIKKQLAVLVLAKIKPLFKWNDKKKERVIYKQIVELCQKDYKIQY